jgi:hypothetical protein
MPWEFIIRAAIFALLAPLWWRVARLADGDRSTLSDPTNRRFARALSQAIIGTLVIGALYVLAPLAPFMHRDRDTETGLF